MIILRIASFAYMYYHCGHNDLRGNPSGSGFGQQGQDRGLTVSYSTEPYGGIMAWLDRETHPVSYSGCRLI
jgi:hypothetical protein